jgi:thiol:disulfide interchange protein DsbD
VKLSLPLRRALAALALCALPLLAQAAVDVDDLLPVEEAFALRADAPARDRVVLQWRIADGYYLYRHRTAVEALDAGVEVGALRLPDGKRHVDEFFGEVETYRGSLRGELPLIVPAGAREVRLRVKSQGCADLGVCYPPQAQLITVRLPATGGAATTPDAGFAALGRALGGPPAATPLPGARIASASDPLPLPPEQAFGFEAIAGDAGTLLLRFTPARGYYLYRDRTSLTLDGDGVALGQPRWPKGVAHRDEHFGEVIVYFDQVDVPVPLRRTRGDAQTATLTATFQGCQDDGICYPPMTRTVRVALPKAEAVPPAGASSAATASPAPSSARGGAT